LANDRLGLAACPRQPSGIQRKFGMFEGRDQHDLRVDLAQAHDLAGLLVVVRAQEAGLSSPFAPGCSLGSEQRAEGT
jgi:hypothetical protein